MIVGALFLFGRLAELQIIKGNYFRTLAEENRIRNIPIVAARGEILARTGEVIVGNHTIKDDNEGGVINGWARDYLFGQVLGHITGYLGEASEGEVGKVDAKCPEKGPRRIGSWVGRSGLEEEYNCVLRGWDGEELIEVDSQGRKIRSLGQKDPKPGENIQTTIDIGLQKKVAEIFKGVTGAVVATDANGQILALYSSPSFDPNVFVKGDKQSLKKRGGLLLDKSLPLFNRAIGGTYHPGSIFKIITATAGLEEGRIDRDYTYEDTGSIRVNEFTYANWYFTQYGGTEGKIGLERAIARSTDTFFYKLGEIVGPGALADWARKFGLDGKTKIDLPGEVANLVPSPEWKERVKGEPWFLGNTYHMAIGQGDLALSPIAVHSIVLAVAANGKVCRPHFVLSEEADCQDIGIKRETLEEIKKGMVGVCSAGGTAYPFFDFEPQAACKTGTAETSEKDKTHAWFTVMAPADFPEIVLTVLVEKGGEGSSVAAPLAREILDYWRGN